MARYLKNTQLMGGSYAVQLPVTSGAVGPEVMVDGQIRFNKSSDAVEVALGNHWRQMARVGTVALVVDEFTGDNAQVDFEMSQRESDAANILVTIGGIYQAPVNTYSVSGKTLTFTSAPPAVDFNGSPNKIIVVHNLNSTNAV